MLDPVVDVVFRVFIVDQDRLLRVRIKNARHAANSERNDFLGVAQVPGETTACRDLFHAGCFQVRWRERFNLGQHADCDSDAAGKLQLVVEHRRCASAD